LTDGFSRLGRLTGLPCLPYDYANGVASDSMVQIMRTTVEVVTDETFTLLAKLVAESLESTQCFWEAVNDKSKLLPFVNVTSKPIVCAILILRAQRLRVDEGYDEANQQFRNLVTLHIRTTLLSDVFATAGFAHGRASISLLQILMSSMTPQVVSNLGALHRASVWENIVLAVGLSTEGINVAPSLFPSVDMSSDQPFFGLDELDPSSSSIPSSGTNGPPRTSMSADTTPSVQVQEKRQKDSRERNATALKHLTHGLPSSLAPFFQGKILRTFCTSVHC
jgi:E3 ubiquitin-protein ligase HUWE1